MNLFNMKKSPVEIVNSEIELVSDTPLICGICEKNGIAIQAKYAWPGVALFPTPYCILHLNRDKHRLAVALGLESNP